MADDNPPSDAPALGGTGTSDSHYLPSLGSFNAVLHAVEKLKHSDRKVRRRAAEALIKIGDATVLDQIVAAIDDPSPVVRARLIRALGAIGDARVMPVLLDALRDPETAVRYEAVMALGELRDPQFAPVFVDVLSQNATMREAGISALRNILNSDIIPLLVDALRPPNNRTVLTPLLIELGDPGTSALVELLATEVLDEGVAWHILRTTFTDTTDLLVDALLSNLHRQNDHVKQYAAYQIGLRRITRAGPVLLEMLRSSHSGLRATVIQALGMVREKGAVEPLIRLLDDTRGPVHTYGENMTIDKFAAQALGRIKDPRAVPYLIEHLKAELAAETRSPYAQVYAKALKSIGTPETKPILEQWKARSRP
jgi:HEAT repeat protein